MIGVTLRTPRASLSETGRLATAVTGQHKNTGALKISAFFNFVQKICVPHKKSLTQTS